MCWWKFMWCTCFRLLQGHAAFTDASLGSCTSEMFSGSSWRIPSCLPRKLRFVIPLSSKPRAPCTCQEPRASWIHYIELKEKMSSCSLTWCHIDIFCIQTAVIAWVLIRLFCFWVWRTSYIFKKSCRPNTHQAFGSSILKFRFIVAWILVEIWIELSGPFIEGSDGSHRPQAVTRCNYSLNESPFLKTIHQNFLHSLMSCSGKVPTQRALSNYLYDWLSFTCRSGQMTRWETLKLLKCSPMKIWKYLSDRSSLIVSFFYSTCTGGLQSAINSLTRWVTSRKGS